MPFSGSFRSVSGSDIYKFRILDVSKFKSSDITFILDDDKSVDEPKDNANIFNNFFTNFSKRSYRKGNPSSES